RLCGLHRRHGSGAGGVTPARGGQAGAAETERKPGAPLCGAPRGGAVIMAITLATVLACGAAAVLILLLVVAEVRRADRRHLPGRIAATILAVLALLMLVLEPSVPRRVRPARAVLLTEGASRSEARDVADSGRARRIVAPGDSIPDRGTLQRLHPEVRELVVVGSGLPDAELRRSGSMGVEFVPRAEAK